VSAAPEVHRLTADLFIWHAFDANVKAELFSTGLRTDAGVYLVDPIAIGGHEIATAAGNSHVAGVIVTNANHARASAELAANFQVPVYVHSAAREEINSPRCVEIGRAFQDLENVQVLAIEGAAPGELALYGEADGGTIVIGDAVINAGSYGFTLLPAKYCVSVKTMRRSLRQLLPLEFQRMLFAHGTPIMAHARERLAQLLDAE
jgi:hypothetical protein